MKITRRQLRQIIKEDIELEKDATEALTTAIAQHIQVLLDKVWKKADFKPDSPTVNADMPNANRFVLTYTFRPSIPNLKAITNKFNSNIAPKTGFKSTPLDNRGNKIFKMGLANENPVTWDGNNKKSAGGYVKLRIRVTLMDKFMATAKADPSIITSGDTETLSISENKMKITRRQLRQIIKEELSRSLSEADPDINSDGALDASELRDLADDLEGEGQQSLESFRLPYKGFGYGGRRIISRDRAWLEFVPKGTDPSTQEDMFRSVTLLDQGDPEVEKVIKRGGWYVDKYLKVPVDNYDVYSVHATTTG